MRITLGSMVVALVLGCAGTGRCGTPTGPGVVSAAVDKGTLPRVADPASMTEAELNAVVEFLVPYVEEAAGAKFTTTPPGLLGTPEALSDVLASETRTVIRSIYDLPDEVIDEMAESARGGIPGLLGKYASSTGAVYLVPGNTASMARGLPGLGDDAAMDVTLIIMAHELTHALQDQVADLDVVLGNLEDLDHFDGVRGVTEGHANWVTLRVARALDREDAFWAVTASQGWGKDGLEHDGAFPVWMLYGQGMAFCEHHAEQGTDRLWELVRRPPRSTTMLFRPERYAPDLDVPSEIVAALVGVEQKLSKVEWVVANTNLGEAPLRRETLGLDQARVERVLGAIRAGYERRAYYSGGSASPRNASLQVIDFDTPEAAVELVELMGAGLESQAAARTEMEAELAKTQPIRPRTWSVEVVPYERVDGDAVIRRIVGPNSASGARVSREEEQALWVVRGTRLVVVSVSGFRPGNRLDSAVDQLFAQLDAASDATP